jgi:hypothetical protein
VANVLVMLVVPDAMAGAWDRVVARIEEVVAISRRLGDRLHLAYILVWLAFATGRAGRPEDARATALEALELFREVDDATGMALAFLDLAFLLTWEGRHTDAVRMAGASQSQRDRAGGGPSPGFGGMLEGDPVAEAGAHLSEEAVKRAWQEGLAMPVQAAVALARADPEAEDAAPAGY